MSDHIDRAAEIIYVEVLGLPDYSPDAVDDHNRHSYRGDCQCNASDRVDARHAAEALDAAGLLRRPTDPEVHVEATGTGRTCVVKVSGQTIFDGVGREALIRTKSAAEHDASVAVKALRRVARALDAEDSNEWADAADQEAVRIIRLIRDEADRIERNATT